MVDLRVILTTVVTAAACAAIAPAALRAASVDSVLIQNVTVHPVSGPDIRNGSVLVIDGKIAEVGGGVQAKDGVRIVDGHGHDLYPGLINAATNVGSDSVKRLRPAPPCRKRAATGSSGWLSRYSNSRSPAATVSRANPVAVATAVTPPYP